MKLKLKGYIALTLVIILLFVIITVGVASSISSVYKIQVSKNAYLSETEYYNLESCIEESLLHLNLEEEIPSIVNIDDDIFCTLELEELIDNEYTYTVSFSSKDVRIKALRTDSVYIYNWEIL